MKKLIVTMSVLLASVVGVAAVPMKAGTASRLQSNKTLISLADAKRRTDKAIAKPSVMKALMQHLSAADQKTFLADVNAAIATMPGSDADRAATYVAVNRAALEGSQPGNVATLVAESYATVPVSAQPALCESLGSDLMNRATDKNRTYTDDDYVRTSSALMTKVNARTAESDHGDVRSGFAALMVIYGSNSTKPEIVDAVTKMLPESAQSTAKNEWFPAALAEGAAKSYDPMLAAADVDGFVAPRNETPTSQGEEPNTDQDYWKAEGGPLVNLRVPAPVLATSMLFDILGANLDATREISTATPIYDALQKIDELPEMGSFDDVNVVIGEAQGYQWQTR